MIGQPLGIASWVDVEQFQPPAQLTIDRSASGDSGVAWLLELEPLQRATGSYDILAASLSGLDPLGCTGLGQVATVSRRIALPAPTRRYVSVAGGLVTAAADTPADTFIPPWLEAGEIRIKRELPATGERLRGFVAATAAQLVLAGGDGALDALLTDEVMRDRPVRLKRAPTTRLPHGVEQPPALGGFALAFAGRCTNASMDQAGRVTVLVADDLSRLDRPLQQYLYPGTGGIQGGKDLEGKPRPLNYGLCPGALPTLVDALRGIYQIHDGQYLSLVVRDRGLALTQVGDVDSYEALEALTTEGEVDQPAIRAGQVMLCRRRGYFRLGGAPAGKVTCDVEGDGLFDRPVGYQGGVLWGGSVGYAIPGADTYSRHAGGILFRILWTRAGFDPAEIDLTRIKQFDAASPWEMGLSVPSGERPTVREACTRLADSVGAVILRNREGQIVPRLLERPGTSSTVQILPLNRAAAPIERLALPWGAPWPEVRVTYARQWAPLTADELSVELDGTGLAEVLTREHAMVFAADPDLAALLPDRAPLELDSLLVRQADAQALAQRLLAFYGAIWNAWRLGCRGIAFRADPLSTVVVTDPRHGLAAGVPLLVCAAEERPGDNATELVLVG